MTSPRLLGAVLAGGRSRRFGSDKGRAKLGDRQLMGHAAEAIAPSCAEVVVVSSLEGHRVPPFETLADTRPDEGPLAALEAALEHAAGRGYDGVFVIACDMPVDPVAAAALSAHFDGQRIVAAAKTAPPGFEPLCAIYPSSQRVEATRLLDAGERAARALFERDPGELVELGPIPNINTPDELAAFESEGHR